MKKINWFLIAIFITSIFSFSGTALAGACPTTSQKLPLPQSLITYTDQLKSYWTFDSGGVSNAGITCTAGAVKNSSTNKPTLKSSIFGQGYSFDGVRGYLDCSGIRNTFDMRKNDLTISAWVKFYPDTKVYSEGGSSRLHTIFDFDYDEHRQFSLRYLRSSFKWTLFDDNQDTDTASNVFWPINSTRQTPDNAWHNVVLVREGSAWRLYINGEKVSENLAYGDVKNNGNRFMLGYDHDWANVSLRSHWGALKGQLDDVAVWSRPLRDCEIYEIYNGPGFCYCDDETNNDSITATCTVSPNPALTNTLVTWSVGYTGTSTVPTYSWTGTSPFPQNLIASSTSVTYNSAGTYYATSTLNFDGLTLTVPCAGSVSSGGGPGDGTPPGVVIRNDIQGACGPAHGLDFSSAPTTDLCSAGTPSDVSGTGTWNWTCSGSDTSTTTDDIDCSANKIQDIEYDPDLNCTLSSIPASPVNVNTEVKYTASPISGQYECSTCTKSWSINDFPDTSSGNYTLNKIFTTTGVKNVSLTISTTTSGQTSQGSCSTTTTVVQSGGGTGEI